MQEARSPARLTILRGARRFASVAALLAVFGFGSQVFAAESASLTLKIERVTPQAGKIKAALFTRDAWPGRHGMAVVNWLVDAVPGETVITMTGLTPGQYAIKAMQDEDRNGKMDFNWFGMPTEPYGFSNDAKPGLDQPDFDKAAISLKPGPNIVIIHLRNI
jgi:uncharacterized protein (DUF2141 family)